MNTRRAIRWLVLAGFCLTTVPAPSFAFFGCCNWFHKKTTPCDACAAPAVPQTVNYVPQTCYRTQYCPVPVVTYRPATSYDPCTGCPTTCLRPVQGTVMQARLVPYTTYRAVLTNPCNTGLCGAPAATTYYAPAAAAPAMAPGGCSTCAAAPMATYAPAAGYAPAGTYAPAYSAPAAAPYGAPNYGGPTYSTPTYSTPGAPANVYPSPSSAPPIYTVPQSQMPSTSVPPASTAPSLSTSPGASTFQNSAPLMQNQLRPIPDTQMNQGPRANPSSSPRLIDPDSRTTSYPVMRAWSHSPVSWPKHNTVMQTAAIEPTVEQPAVAQPQAQPPVDNDGWRPSNR